MSRFMSARRAVPGMSGQFRESSHGRPRVRRILALLVLAVSGQACTTWRPTPIPPRQLIANESPRRIRVTTTDDSILVLESPEVVGDRISGTKSGCRQIRTAGGHQCVPFAYKVSVSGLEVQKTEVRRVDAGRTVVAVLAVPVVFVGVLMGLVAASGGPWGN